MNDAVHHCIIIGSGPAGYAAAIYAARANMHPVLFQGIQPGGQLMLTTDVENYPGYPDGILGPNIMEDFRKQAERMGAELKFGMIEKVDFIGPVHKLYTDAGEVIKSNTVIIATGASAKWLGLPSEQRLNGSGVSACAVCDGFFYKGQEVAIVGGGDTACEEALYLSKLSPKVHMLVRGSQMRASAVMQERVLKKQNIVVYWNTEVIEVLGEMLVNGLRLYDKIGDKTFDIAITGFFVAIGHQPNSEPFKSWLEVDDVGYIKTQHGSTKTNIAGVFAAGDVQDRTYRQAVTAAGSGCMAALDAERYLTAMGIH